jgi:hypothetical protein
MRFGSRKVGSAVAVGPGYQAYQVYRAGIDVSPCRRMRT